LLCVVLIETSSEVRSLAFINTNGTTRVLAGGYNGSVAEYDLSGNLLHEYGLHSKPVHGLAASITKDTQFITPFKASSAVVRPSTTQKRRQLFSPSTSLNSDGALKLFASEQTAHVARLEGLLRPPSILQPLNDVGVPIALISDVSMKPFSASPFILASYMPNNQPLIVKPLIPQQNQTIEATAKQLFTLTHPSLLHIITLVREPQSKDFLYVGVRPIPSPVSFVDYVSQQSNQTLLQRISALNGLIDGLAYLHSRGWAGLSVTAVVVDDSGRLFIDVSSFLQTKQQAIQSVGFRATQQADLRQFVAICCSLLSGRLVQPADVEQQLVSSYIQSDKPTSSLIQLCQATLGPTVLIGDVVDSFALLKRQLSGY
jgi:hypothetical protein